MMLPWAVLCLAQQPTKPVHPTHGPIAVSEAPVTAREARAAFARATTLLEKVNGRPLGTVSIPVAAREATRAEIVAEMGRIYVASEPTFRIVPMAVAHDAARFRIDPSQRATLDRLVARGCVARLGPLATGSKPGLSPKELGDALGFFVARLGQMSHLPSPKWTPSLTEG